MVSWLILLVSDAMHDLSVSHMLITCIHVECLPGALNVRRRAPSLYKKLLKGLYSPVPNKTMYNDSRITGSPESGSANSRGDDLDRTESYPLSLSVLPKRQRKRFFLPGKEMDIKSSMVY